MTIKRSAEEAKKLCQSQFERLEGSPLPPTFYLIFTDHEGGAPMGHYQKQGMVGIEYAPKRYWQELSDNALAAVNAQEMANHLFPDSPLEIELAEELEAVDREYSREEFDRNRIRRRNRIRLEFELYKGLLIVVLSRKFKVDDKAIDLLRNAGMSTQGYTEYLEAEIQEEWRQPEPFPRKVARSAFAQIRLEHARMILSENEALIAEARNLVRFYEERSRQILQAHSEGKTPSTV